MPKEACIRNAPEDRLGEKGWSLEHHLLALLVEVTSIPAAGMQLKKPITLKRPKDEPDRPHADAPEGSAERDDAFKRGISVLANSAKKVSDG